MTWKATLLLAITPFLTSCFELRQIQAETASLIQEKQEVDRLIPLYDQHIEYYRTQLPPTTVAKIGLNVDPFYPPLSEHVQKVEAELLDLKVNMASRNTYLQMLREESSRLHSLNNE